MERDIGSSSAEYGFRAEPCQYERTWPTTERGEKRELRRFKENFSFIVE